MKRAGASILVLALALGSCARRGAMEFDAIFADIGDLANRASVQYSDVEIGSVTDIRLDGYRARVTMRVDPEVVVPANAQAVIRSTSLLGEKFVEIRVPEGVAPEGRLRSGATIPLERTGKAAEVDQVLAKLGAILEGGGVADLAVIVDSSAEILRDKEGALGEILSELRRLTGTVAGRAPEIGAAVDGLDAAFAALGGGSGTLRRAVASTAEVSRILASRQSDLDRLVSALDRFAAVSARYTSATTPASDRALDDIRLVLDQVMAATGDLEASLAALARFVELWPRMIPGDYIQLDVVSHPSNELPSQVAAVPRPPRAKSLHDLLWEAAR